MRFKLMTKPESDTKLLSDDKIEEILRHYENDFGDHPEYRFMANRIKEVRGDDAYKKYVESLGAVNFWFGSAWYCEYAEFVRFCLNSLGNDIATYFIDTILSEDEKLSSDAGRRACNTMYFIDECYHKNIHIHGHDRL